MTSIDDKSVASKFAILAAATLMICMILVLLAEAVIRVRHYVKYGDFWGIEDTYVVDEDSRLRIPVPNGEFGPIRINSMGYRSPEIAMPKADGTLRIAFLGASTTYCAEVSSNEAAWPSLVIDDLRAVMPETNIDFVNAGVPGYSVSTSLRNLQHRVAKLQPDVIVIYHAINDMSANSFNLAKNLGITSERTERTMAWPSKFSLLWYLVEKNLMVIASQRASQDTDEKLIFDPIELSAPFVTDLTDLVQGSKQVAESVVLVTFSARIRHSQTESERTESAVTSLYYSPYMTTDGLIKAFDAYNESIRSVAAEEGVLLIEAAASIPGDSAHFHDSVHFTDAGSRKMAEVVSASLTEFLSATESE